MREPVSQSQSHLDPSQPSPRDERQTWLLAVLGRSQLLRARWSLLLGCAVLAIAGFIKLTAELNEGELESFDRAALEQIAALRVPTLNGSAVDVTALGSVTVLTLLCTVSLGLLVMQRDRLGACQLFLAACGGGLLSHVLKNALTRARPDHVERLVAVSSYSYPSGHSLASASVYLTLAIVASRHLSTQAAKTFLLTCAIVLMSGIGFSRAYLGVHYPSDIGAGLLVGAGWSLLVSALFSYVRARQLRAAADA